MAYKKSNNRKTKNKYQRGTPPGVNVFRDRDANKAVNTGIATGLASALGRSGVVLGQNRALDRDAYNMWMDVKDNSSQFSGYQDFNDYCLTGDCPQRPFQDGAPTFRDWRRGARQENSDFGNNSINTYRRVAGYEENPLQGKGILKKAGRDAIIGGAVNYGFNKMFPNANIGGIPFKVGYRGFQGGGAAGNPYSMPTSAATSGYTSTMSGMAGAHQSAMQLAQIQQEIIAEQERRRREDEAADAASKARLQKEASSLTSEEFLGQASDAVKDISANRAAKATAQDAAMKQAATDYGTSLTGAGANATSNIVQGGRMAAEAASPTANIVMNPMYTQGSKQVMTSAVPGVGQEVALQGAQQGAQEAGTQVATEAGKNIGLGASAANPSWANPAAAVAAIGGRAVEHFADDDDDTRVNVGEGVGRGLAGAGQGASVGLMFGPIGGIIGAGVGALASLTTQQIQKRKARKEAERRARIDALLGSQESTAFKNAMVRQGQDMGYNIGNSMTNSYLPGYQQGVIAEAGGWPWPDKEARMLNQQKRQTKKAQKLFEKASKKAKRKGGSALDYMR